MSIAVKIEDLLTEQYKGKRKDTGANAFLCLEDVTTCINYTFGFVGRSVAGCSDAPNQSQASTSHLFPPLLYLSLLTKVHC